MKNLKLAHKMLILSAILIGSQGEEQITAEEVARRLDTINYEVTCALTGRVPRVYHHDGVPAEQPAGRTQLRATRARQSSVGRA